jgi:hypothetical protein
MGDKINKEYDEFKSYLDKKEQKIKLIVGFELEDNIEETLKELNKREIIF